MDAGGDHVLTAGRASEAARIERARRRYVARYALEAAACAYVLPSAMWAVLGGLGIVRSGAHLFSATFAWTFVAWPLWIASMAAAWPLWLSVAILLVTRLAVCASRITRALRAPDAFAFERWASGLDT